MKALAPLLAVVSLFAANIAGAKSPVIVHEWGTFTSLQDENGKAIGGINVDDEPVPNFVYTAGQHSVVALNHNPFTFGLPPYCGFIGKGGPAVQIGDPEVTMRLETPVLYIYPPKGEAAADVPPLDVHVDFHGGILSQYYPYDASWLGRRHQQAVAPYQRNAGRTLLEQRSARLDRLAGAVRGQSLDHPARNERAVAGGAPPDEGRERRGA